MNNKKQDWRTADSKMASKMDSKTAGRDQTDRNTASDKPTAGKKPLNEDTSAKKASSPRHTGELSAGKTSRR